MWKQVRAILQWIRRLIGSQWRSKSKEVVRADLGALQMRRVEQLITLFKLSRRTRGEPARILQESSQEEKRENGSFCGFKIKTLSD